MNIIKSDIINSAYDVFWEDISPQLKEATPRPLLVLVNSYVPGSPEEIQLLKIIDSCKVPPAQYNIVQIAAGEQMAWHQLREKLGPRVIFMLGIHPLQLGISSIFFLNEPNNFNDRIWLATASINDLENHKDTKVQLWQKGINPIFIHKKYGDFFQ